MTVLGLRGMWDLPRPGLEPVSPALAGRFSTTAPPGKPNTHTLLNKYVRGARNSIYYYSTHIAEVSKTRLSH